jgi:hypothetical protein
MLLWSQLAFGVFDKRIKCPAKPIFNTERVEPLVGQKVLGKGLKEYKEN